MNNLQGFTFILTNEQIQIKILDNNKRIRVNKANSIGENLLCMQDKYKRLRVTYPEPFVLFDYQSIEPYTEAGSRARMCPMIRAEASWAKSSPE